MSSEGPWEGNVLQTLCLKVFLRPPKKLRDEPRNFEEGLGRVRAGSNEVPWEGNGLQTVCFKVLLKHPRKFEEGLSRAPGGQCAQ